MHRVRGYNAHPDPHRVNQGPHQSSQHSGHPESGYIAPHRVNRSSRHDTQHHGHHVPQHSPHEFEATLQSTPQPQDQPQLSSCQICSYTQPYPARQVEVFHRHFSSLRLRELLGIETSNKEYLCPSCKCQHLPYPDSRVKIVLSDSTLHQFFAPPDSPGSQYVGDMLHVDYITIKEGFIQDLVHAFRLDYELLEHPKPLDVVVVAGYQDLMNKHSRDFIMEGFEHITNLVHDIGAKHHPATPNTCAIASLMYPPALSWFDDNGPEPFSFTYNNYIEKIDWLNDKINQLNLSNSLTQYPRFHTYGVRTATRSSHGRYGHLHQFTVKSHRWEHWDGPIKAKKFHLRGDRKFKMGSAVNNYFILNTK